MQIGLWIRSYRISMTCWLEALSLKTTFVEELVSAILDWRIVERQWELQLREARSKISTTPPAHKKQALRILDEAVSQGREVSSLLKFFRQVLLEEI